ncbi:hypothetical protein ABI59_17970 [Acidobacteria bacterium Mor1]|nr:hypothetical protein ABI59_17970 [Acidobacteria bacterium Mor1]
MTFRASSTPFAFATLLLFAVAVPAAADRASAVALPAEVAQQAAAHTFSAEELAGHDDRDPNRPLLLAVRGVVFDVSSGRDFYGPEGKYHGLAGKDASRAMGMWTLAEADLNDDCDAMSAEQWTAFNEVFLETYVKQYPVVGHLRGGYFFPNGLCCEGVACGDCAPGE